MPESKQVDRAKLKGLRVLIVDDNAVNCRILEETLANWQMLPAAVCSGRAALEAMQAAADAGEAYPLVLLDVMMPEMDGFALAEEIQRTPSLGGATVMMLSSAVRTGEMKRASALGVQSVLTKPVMQSELLEAILLSLGGNELVTLHGQDSAAIRNVPTKCSLDILVAEDNVIIAPSSPGC
jgi:CheY-like chemotaxis protein